MTDRKDSTLENLLQTGQEALAQNIQPLADNFPKIVLTAYLIRSRLNLQAIQNLCQMELFSECAPLVAVQIEMRLRSMVLISAGGTFAAKILRWHEEFRNRLDYLGLKHLALESSHLDFFLQAAADHSEGKELLRQWFSQKPQPQNQGEEWLRNWHLWNLERLAFEVNKNLVESPRVRKEIANFLEFIRDHDPGTLLPGVKRYALIDEELDRVTFCTSGEERWPLGPAILATTALLDMLFEISHRFDLHLEKNIDAYRSQLTPHHFLGKFS